MSETWEYSVKKFEHGIAIFHELPWEHAVSFFKMLEHLHGYEILDSLISGHLKCNFAVTTKEGSKKWRKELGLQESDDA